MISGKCTEMGKTRYDIAVISVKPISEKKSERNGNIPI